MKRLTSILIALILSTSAWALPPQIEADRLLLSAKSTLDASDFEGAIQNFEKVEALNVKMPDTFYFHFGKAYSGAKKWANARTSYGKYLEKYGSSGKFYREALEGYNQAEIESIKAEKEEKNRQLEAIKEQEQKAALATSQRAQREARYQKELADYKYDVEHYDERVKRAKNSYNDAVEGAERCSQYCINKYKGFFGNGVKMQECASGCRYPDSEKFIPVPKEPLKPS